MIPIQAHEGGTALVHGIWEFCSTLVWKIAFSAFLQYFLF